MPADQSPPPVSRELRELLAPERAAELRALLAEVVSDTIEDAAPDAVDVFVRLLRTLVEFLPAPSPPVGELDDGTLNEALAAGGFPANASHRRSMRAVLAALASSRPVRAAGSAESRIERLVRAGDELVVSARDRPERWRPAVRAWDEARVAARGRDAREETTRCD